MRRGGVFGVIGAAGGRLDAAWYGGLPRDGEVFWSQGSNIADVQEVIALVAEGRVRDEVETFPLERVEEAYSRLRDGSLRGRAVVTFE